MGRKLRIVCVVITAALLTSACSIGSKRLAVARLSRDLQANGFSITMSSGDDDAPVATVAVTDAESTDRLLQWLRQRPQSAGILGGVFLEAIEEPLAAAPIAWPVLRLETTRLRASFRFLSVVLETRRSPHHEWKQDTWPIRDEDQELRHWANEKLIEGYRQQMQGT